MTWDLFDSFRERLALHPEAAAGLKAVLVDPQMYYPQAYHETLADVPADAIVESRPYRSGDENGHETWLTLLADNEDRMIGYVWPVQENATG